MAWQPDGERRAPAVDTGDGEVAAHQPAEVAADREAQPGPAVPGSGAGLGLGERLAQPAQLLLRHPAPGVRDRKSEEALAPDGRGKPRPYQVAGRGDACVARLPSPHVE